MSKKEQKLTIVKHADIWRKMTVSELIDQYQKVGFNGKELAKARDVLKAMNADKNCIKFLTLAGALVPGGLKHIIYTMIENGLVDGLIVTGATLTHDLIEAFWRNTFSCTITSFRCRVTKKRIKSYL